VGGLILSFDFAVQPGLGKFLVAGGKDVFWFSVNWKKKLDYTFR
jgi:hypothetical protein